MALALGTNKAAWGNGTGNPLTESGITLSANSKIFVLLISSALTAGRGDTNPPSFDGVDMTQAGTAQAGSAEANSELWYLFNPSLSSSTLSIPNANGVNLYYSYISFTTTSGVALHGTPQQTGTSSGTPTLTINNVPAEEGQGCRDRRESFLCQAPGKHLPCREDPGGNLDQAADESLGRSKHPGGSFNHGPCKSNSSPENPAGDSGNCAKES